MSEKPTDSEATKQALRLLAYEWSQLELPSIQVTYADYVRSLMGLHSATGNLAQTQRIVKTILHQAKSLGKPAEWVAAELKFEALAEAVGNRASLVRLDLVHRLPVTDTSLDLYNERVTRFNHHD